MIAHLQKKTVNSKILCVYFTRDHQGNTSLHLACMNNRIRHAQTLLRMGADLNLVNDYGFTPLHIAAQLGCEEMVAVFLQENEECQFKRDHQK